MECCDSPFQDDQKPSREKSTSNAKFDDLQSSTIVEPTNVVRTWSDWYRFNANTLN
jgi:hypothetical protein